MARTQLFSAFVVFSTFLQLCQARHQPCVARWLGSSANADAAGLINNCDLLKEKLFPNLKVLVDKPECVNSIAYKVNGQTYENDWDQKDPDKVVAFETSKAFCQPLNLTVGVRFWNGTTHEIRKVKSTGHNPLAHTSHCLKELTSDEIQSLREGCQKRGKPCPRSN